MGSASSIDTTLLPAELEQPDLEALLGADFDEAKFNAHCRTFLGNKIVPKDIFEELLRAGVFPGGGEAPEPAAAPSLALAAALAAQGAKTQEEKAARSSVVLSAALLREERHKVDFDRRRAEEGADYSRGFSGTKADTKAEKDFAKLANTGGEPTEVPTVHQGEEPLHDLAFMEGLTPSGVAALAGEGEWLKIMGGGGLLDLGQLGDVPDRDEEARRLEQRSCRRREGRGPLGPERSSLRSDGRNPYRDR